MTLVIDQYTTSVIAGKRKTKKTGIPGRLRRAAARGTKPLNARGLCATITGAGGGNVVTLKLLKWDGALAVLHND